MTIQQYWKALEADGLLRYKPDCREGRETEGLGVSLSHYFDGDMEKLLLACAEGLEDWNWHEDAYLLRKRAAEIAQNRLNESESDVHTSFRTRERMKQEYGS